MSIEREKQRSLGIIEKNNEKEDKEVRHFSLSEI